MDLMMTEQDVLADLGVGRWAPLTVPAPLAPRRPGVRSTSAAATALGARVTTALHMPVADRLLERLWFTPWVVGGSRRVPEGAHPFEVPFALDGRQVVLSGWQAGDGPAVLFVHGWGGRSTDLTRLAERVVATGRRAVAVDLPGHGASPGRDVDLFQMGEAVRAAGRLAEHLMGPLAGVVAHSIGSVATILALADGMPVDRAVVIAPPATLDAAVRRQTKRAGLRGAPEARLRRRIEARYGADVWQRLDVATTAPGIATDVLVVHDVDDREVPVGEGVRVARAFGTEPVLTTGLGHGRVLVDDDVARRVLAHLA